MIAASAAGEGSAMTSTDQVRDAFVERLFASALGTMDVFTVYLGDRLGLYRVLAEHGPLTAGELAERAGINARYAREWLEQQAATGDPRGGRRGEAGGGAALLASGRARRGADRSGEPVRDGGPLPFAGGPWRRAPEARRCVPDRRGRRRGGGRRGRGAGGLQPAMAGGLVRHRVPPTGPRRAREAQGRRARRGRRVRRGVGRRLDRARIPRDDRGWLRPGRTGDRAGPRQRPGRGRGRPGHVPGARRG